MEGFPPGIWNGLGPQQPRELSSFSTPQLAGEAAWVPALGLGQQGLAAPAGDPLQTSSIDNASRREGMRPPEARKGPSGEKHSLLSYKPPLERDLVTGHGAKVVIRAHPWEGRVVWSKLAGFPWWPAQVLIPGDPFIPRDGPPPRTADAVPVRFFGTYDFSWISNQKSIVPFFSGYADKVNKSLPDPEFQTAVQEAITYQQTGELPIGFEEALRENEEIEAQLPPPLPPKPGKKKRPQGAGKADKLTPPPYKASKPSKLPGHLIRAPEAARSPRAAGGEPSQQPGASDLPRALRIARGLALLPPAGSPFAQARALHPDLRQML
uniref:PWWP domain-containing protein n=1 Tax=Tetraselmis sp. GSL018 TaxID=582737 RepID=A0A061RG98_9CHLO|mmetsp:Transcript_12470/g.29630  ORF Transcript_12470/g.29630 Transcript_12470/m.29630 type:complete len:323 (-) Transcript_12470:28-996(-)|eukprot:CAMPEP_0177587818 /NCGR_PEP_ID=MMETSP0419_2-20121207/5871_1 /TAXON_ID=582737 /ORGANISM="Tetraselmis sp., Strain GSL018" /LENGTH=322 /DNA_ID=CAMNT_0019077927 /DNA_START=363 /DNA_END=1331 /DNA_ORIENTATION=+